MSGFNNNDDSFLNLMGGWNNPNAGSSSPNIPFPNPLGLSSQELYLQHQRFLYWEQNQQNTLNTNFQNLQFSQQSQPPSQSSQTQTETNEVPETPTSPTKPFKRGGKRKAKKSKDPEPIEENEENPDVTNTRWQSSEEKLLAKCYVAATEDPQVGRAQARDTFWKRVINEFNRLNFQNRNKDMLQGKWKTLNRDCMKFNAYYKRSKRNEKSGESEMDIMRRAREMYRDEHKSAPFNNEEAWEVLRAHQKWDAPEPLDLTGDVPSQTNEALFGHDEQLRPMGKKRASKKAKSESTTSTGGASTGGTSSSSQFGEVMQHEYRIKREDASMAYRAVKEKDETITRLEEMKFLMIDASDKDPNVAFWINSEKDRII